MSVFVFKRDADLDALLLRLRRLFGHSAKLPMTPRGRLAPIDGSNFIEQPRLAGLEQPAPASL